MYFGINEHIVIEDYPFKVNEEYIRNHIKNVSFCCVGSLAATLTKTVRYKLSCVHAFKGRMQIIFTLYFNTVSEKLLDPLSLGSTTVTDHLRYLISLEKFIKYIFIGCLFETILELVKQKVQKLSSILL